MPFIARQCLKKKMLSGSSWSLLVAWNSNYFVLISFLYVLFSIGGYFSSFSFSMVFLYVLLCFQIIFSVVYPHPSKLRRKVNQKGIRKLVITQLTFFDMKSGLSCSRKTVLIFLFF